MDAQAPHLDSFQSMCCSPGTTSLYQSHQSDDTPVRHDRVTTRVRTPLSDVRYYSIMTPSMFSPPTRWEESVVKLNPQQSSLHKLPASVQGVPLSSMSKRHKAMSRDAYDAYTHVDSIAVDRREGAVHEDVAGPSDATGGHALGHAVDVVQGFPIG